MNNKLPTLLFFAFLFFVTVQSCVDHKSEAIDPYDCDAFKEVSFEIDIQPIINSNCAIVGDGGCHNGGNGADLDWRVFSNFQSHASSVKDRVTRPVGATGHMPKVGEITDGQIKLLVCWVEQGALDN